MTVATIREILHDFINAADDEQIQSIYPIFEDLLAPQYDPWEDDAFLKELKNRLDDIESGKAKGIPWEEVKIKARLDARRNP